MISTNSLPLSKPALKKIVLCSYIMSGIDGYMDESEFEVIEEFTDKNWLEIFGEKEEFFKEIDHEVLAFFVPTEGKFGLNKDNIIKIIDDLTIEEELVLMNLMNGVMEADGIIDPAEVSLMKIIKDHIEVRTLS
ncbi:MAG: TerB family tellurite resistance protein [SAR324 cluster bacterium]|nr:TerB family tellurite resistance protein [SAR324 cluster bacterium]